MKVDHFCPLKIELFFFFFLGKKASAEYLKEMNKMGHMGRGSVDSDIRKGLTV